MNKLTQLLNIHRLVWGSEWEEWRWSW